MVVFLTFEAFAVASLRAMLIAAVFFITIKKKGETRPTKKT
jgi:hypothetical protein